MSFRDPHVDLPDVDTLLLLRPTDSPTLFLQQLGRGLRRAANKTVCTVLDFIGQHRREFRFDRRLRALLGGTRKEITEQVERGFPMLPAGCHMELDRVASEIVLRSIREAIPSRWPHKVSELRALVAAGKEASLAVFFEQSGLDLGDVYQGSKCWSDLCNDAGVSIAEAGPSEPEIRRAVGRLLHLDDVARLDFYSEILRQDHAPRLEQLTEHDRRLIRMLVAALVGPVVTTSTSLQEGIDLLWAHPQVRRELLELLPILQAAIDHVTIPLEGRPNVPLTVHASYSRLEILASFGVGEGAKVAPWQTGVRWLPEARADLFAFTLDKTDGNFSPTTRYKDYAISQELIHWESQSSVRADSSTAQRYIHHVEHGSEVMLFARLRQQDRAFWFLGPATYVRHSGERPMAVVWKLRHPLPGDLFQVFAAAVA